MMPHEITDGPSKWDLMIALFKGESVYFTFELSDSSSSSERLRVLSVGRSKSHSEDREFWEISGMRNPLVRFKCVYSTKSRKGEINFEPY